MIKSGDEVRLKTGNGISMLVGTVYNNCCDCFWSTPAGTVKAANYAFDELELVAKEITLEQAERLAELMIKRDKLDEAVRTAQSQPYRKLLKYSSALLSQELGRLEQEMGING